MIELHFDKVFAQLKAEGVSTEEIAKKAGINRMMLWRLSKAKRVSENKSNFSLALIDKVCTRLGVNLNQVVKYHYR